MDTKLSIPKCLLTVLNQLYEMEQKLQNAGEPTDLARNLGKMKDAFAEEGLPDTGGGRIRLAYENPMGQKFKETRTDVEATIAGAGTEDLVIVEVIKPIIRAFVEDGVSVVVQKGIVLVESRKGAVT